MLAGVAARARSLWRALSGRAPVEREMDAEFRLHLELRAEDLVRGGMTAAEAKRVARLEFGIPERYKHEARKARGLLPFDALGMSRLDVKLGFRMLVKYPGLTVVGGLAFAFAIWVGAAAFEFLDQVIHPRLPLPAGERVVALENWDAAAGGPDPRVSHDFVAWRVGLKSVEELGAYQLTQRNLNTGEGDVLPAEVAEISASAFRVARVRPLLGRALSDADERPDAPAVAVIGYDVWQVRFAGDPQVVGRVVRLGRTPTTVVGVMPEGYAFPVAQSLWVPLRVSALDYPSGQGPALQLFGRLAPGVTLEEAQAELTTLGRRAAADFPSAHRHLRPRVMPYAQSVLVVATSNLWMVLSSNVFFVMLLVLVCGNVALLMFARAATREAELVVRNALGASRGRIVAQLFAEALVLGGAAALVGLGAAGVGLRWFLAIIALDRGRRFPFWIHGSLSPATVLYAALLTVLGAAIAGVLPALKITRGMGTRLRQATAGGGGPTFGGIWTAVIVAQIAVTVAFPSAAFYARSDVTAIRAMETEFPAAGEFLSARVGVDREPPPGADTSFGAFVARRLATARELERRLRAEPGVVGVTLAERLPQMEHPPHMIEVDSGGAAPINPRFPGGYRVSAAVVDVDYFDVLGAPVRAGRAFQAGDLAPEAHAVIVNESFVKLVLGGRNPIGRRVRYTYLEQWRSGKAEPGPWHTIVGVVPDLGMAKRTPDPKVAGIYHPLAPDVVVPLYVAIHVRGDPAAFAPRLRAVAVGVDPTLRVDAVAPMNTLSDAGLEFIAFWVRITLVVSAVAMLLSLAGIYAVMSFTVARRTREIGVRVALGSDPRRVVTTIFARPLIQVALGVAAGGVLTATLGRSVRPTFLAGVAGYATLMLGVCLLACVVPTRRALAVEPTEALRSE